ncbi:hypothetical protein IAQ61_011969 [Plenodomus lingam]|uniref:uncharacterized protein n=1 Tax=Leptosphaeria maculans TaxID=5022 RepID=UPI003322119B|nr:hypothetical protein IAQ61_011969 [Plenodomus lingam]
MSTPRAGRGGDRVRGARGGNTANRGSNGRGRGNGGQAQINSERPAQGVYTRGQRTPRGPRGGATTYSAANARGRGGAHSNSYTANPTGAMNTTPHAMGDYKKRLDHIKAQRPKLRAQFVRDGLMNPEGQMRLSDSVKLYGICTDMCPEFERVRRIVEEDVKAPECTIETEHLPRKERIPDESRMVKAYSRSAAGAEQEMVSDIRSPATCLKTINYLYERLDHDDFDFLHQWLWDRTRAVRKDLRTQRIESKSDINILLNCLERSARFLLLSAHHMARSTRDDYTHQQDIEQLNQTLMSLKERYVDNRRANIPSENEAEFWAYQLILAPIYTNSQLENELHRVPSDIRNNPRVKVAIEIFRALKSVLITSNKNIIQCQSNWKHFWDLIKSPRVSYLMACAAEVSFNRMRHVVLDSIWRSYRQGTSRVPKSIDGWTPSRLKDALGLDNDSEAVKHCEAYGFVFERAEAGHTYLDFTRKGYQNHVLGMPSADAELKPQIFSDSIVEAKRHDRALSAVIQGMSVQQARTRGLVMDGGDMQVEEDSAEDPSLFIPEAAESSSRPGPFDRQANGTASTSFNPTANPFLPGTPSSSFSGAVQPTGTPASSPFTFGRTTPTPQSTPAPTSNGVQSGLFDASKNAIHFSTPAAANGSAVSSTSSTTPAASGNLFLNASNASTTPAVNPFAGFHAQKTTGSVAPATPEVKPAFTSAGFNFQKATTTGALAASEVKPAFTSAGFGLQEAGSTAAPTTPEVKPAFNSASFNFQKAHSQETLQPAISFTSTGALSQSDTITPAHESQIDKDQREAIEKARREAELQQKQAEAKEATQNAIRQKRAEAEAEQQRKQAEAAAQQECAKRQQEEQERRVREERERHNREAQRRQALEEQARISQAREKEAAWKSLTMDVMFGSSEGLMLQFLENTTRTVAEEAMDEVQKERMDWKGEQLYREYQLGLMRSALAKIVKYVEKKKKMNQARERRRRLKAHRMQVAQIQEEVETASGEGGPVTAPKPLANESVLHPPVLAQDTRRTQPAEERRGGRQQNGTANGAITKSNASQRKGSDSSTTQINGAQTKSAVQKAVTSSTQSNKNASVNGYSKSYHQSTAPIDRTETDWFALRAMGIDPSKHRKRSFGSPSSDDDAPLQIEPKRAKLSPEEGGKNLTSQPQEPEPQPQQSMSLVESQRAHLRAIQEKFRKSASGDRGNWEQSVSGQSIGSMNSVRTTKDRRESDVIARARKLVASTSHSTCVSPAASVNGKNTIHDFGRSVPNLGSSLSASTSFAFRSSLVNANPVFDRPNAPAYWHRTSRFVPRECYGKGPEAIREYREKWGLNGSLSSSATSTPRPLSMEPAQQQQQSQFLGSSVPETQMQMQSLSPTVSQYDAEEYLRESAGWRRGESSYVPEINGEQNAWGHGNAELDAYMYDEGDGEDEDDDGQEEEEEESNEDEEVEDYDEDDEDDEDDEEQDESEPESESESDSALHHPAQQPQVPSTWAGTTQDDAIELSD